MCTLYFRESKWRSETSTCEVTVITSEGCLSVGDALREIDGHSVIKSDFVLVNGDIVSNMQLKSLIQKHKYVTVSNLHLKPLIQKHVNVNASFMTNLEYALRHRCIF